MYISKYNYIGTKKKHIIKPSLFDLFNLLYSFKTFKMMKFILNPRK